MKKRTGLLLCVFLQAVFPMFLKLRKGLSGVILFSEIVCTGEGGTMAKVSNQKQKILYLMKILLEKTDEQHVLSMAEIQEELSRYGMSAERKTVYADIETLREYGMDIISRKERPAGYYVAGREFELPELKLLVDAVQSSKFLTAKKSAQLIKKLEGLTSRYEAKQLQRQVVVTDRIKTMNESIYYNVDEIHMAISRNVKIRFRYGEWTVSKEIRLKKDGAYYCISPWALTWDNENYYMIGYDEEAGKIKHYRVDKMRDIGLTGRERVGREYFDSLDMARYTKKTFGMFGGEDEVVQLLCRDHLVGVIIDRFGSEVPIRPAGEGTFLARVQVAVSPQFFGWAAGIGSGLQIYGPAKVKDAYLSYLKEILEAYGEEKG